MQISKKKKNPPAIKLKGKRGDFAHAVQSPPRPATLQVLSNCEWGELNQITEHSTKYQSEFENSPMS